MTKEKALYQVKLVIDNLTEEDYKLIPQEILDYLNQNMQYDENIKIDPSLPFEKNELDPKTYDYLEKIIQNIEKKQKEQDELNKKLETYKGYERLDFINEIEYYKSEIEKSMAIKKLLEDYKNIVDMKDNEIKEVKESNKVLYNSITKCPKLIKKLFFKDFDSKKLLN